MYKEKLPPNFNYNERKKLLFVLYTKTVGQKKKVGLKIITAHRYRS